MIIRIISARNWRYENMDIFTAEKKRFKKGRKGE